MMSSYLNRQQRWQQCVVSSHWRVASRRKEQGKWIQRQLSSLSQTVESSSACIKDPSENPFRGILIFSIEQSLQLNLQHSLSALKTRRNTTSRSAWTFLSEKRRGSDSILNIALHIKDRANQISIMFYHKFHLRKRQESYIGNGLAHNCRGHLLKSERFERRARAWMWKGRLSADKCQALKCQLCIWCLKTQLFPLVSVNSLCICATHQGVKNFISTINPRLSYWFGSFHANPKEFLHHCESHARLPEGRLETHFFFFFYQKTSVSSKQCHHLSIC